MDKLMFLTRNGERVYRTLASRAQDGQVTVTRADLSSRIGINPRTVSRAVAELEAEGLLTRSGPNLTTYSLTPLDTPHARCKGETTDARPCQTINGLNVDGYCRHHRPVTDVG